MKAPRLYQANAAQAAILADGSVAPELQANIVKTCSNPKQRKIAFQVDHRSFIVRILTDAGSLTYKYSCPQPDSLGIALTLNHRW